MRTITLTIGEENVTACDDGTGAIMSHKISGESTEEAFCSACVALMELAGKVTEIEREEMQR